MENYQNVDVGLFKSISSNPVSILFWIAIFCGVIYSCSMTDNEQIINKRHWSISQYVKENFPDYSVLGRDALDKDMVKYLQSEENIKDPSNCTGDFDGNNTIDYSFFLISDKKIILIVVLTYSDICRHFILEDIFQERGTLEIFLKKMKKGETIEPFDGSNEPQDTSPFTLDSDAIQFGIFEKSSKLYYWKDNSFQNIWLSD